MIAANAPSPVPRQQQQQQQQQSQLQHQSQQQQASVPQTQPGIVRHSGSIVRGAIHNGGTHPEESRSEPWSPPRRRSSRYPSLSSIHLEARMQPLPPPSTAAWPPPDMYGRQTVPSGQPPQWRDTDRYYYDHQRRMYPPALPPFEHHHPHYLSDLAYRGHRSSQRSPPHMAAPPDSSLSRLREMSITGKRVLPSASASAMFSKKPKTSTTGRTAAASGLDKLDLLCSATLEMGPLHDNPMGCSCPKSKCVALYCDCFKAGRRCDPGMCTCLDCHNTLVESGANGARTRAIRGILARNPRAFTTAGIGKQPKDPNQLACNCLRSRCLKLYCSCFQRSAFCQPNVCTCIECHNLPGHPARELARQVCLEKRPDAFGVRVRPVGGGCACKNNRCVRKYCECFRTGLACDKSKCTCRDCENPAVVDSKKPEEAVGVKATSSSDSTTIETIESSSAVSSPASAVSETAAMQI